MKDRWFSFAIDSIPIHSVFTVPHETVFTFDFESLKFVLNKVGTRKYTRSIKIYLKKKRHSESKGREKKNWLKLETTLNMCNRNVDDEWLSHCLSAILNQTLNYRCEFFIWYVSWHHFAIYKSLSHEWRPCRILYHRHKHTIPGHMCLWQINRTREELNRCHVFRVRWIEERR